MTSDESRRIAFDDSARVEAWLVSAYLRHWGVAEL